MLILFSLGSALKAQEIQLIDSLFYRGVKAYKAKHFNEALEHLEFLDRVYPGHRRSTGSLLMRAKTLYRLGEYQRSVEAFNLLLSQYPESKYADDALYGKAMALYQLNVYDEAVIILFQLLDRGGDTRLLHKAAILSTDIMDYRLDVHGLRRLLDPIQDERGQAAITLRIVQRLMKTGQHQQCKDLLESFIQKFPRSVYMIEIQQKLRQVNELAKGSLKLGVILPVSGEMAEQGKAVLSGIKYAADKHNAQGLTKVELVVRDSQGKMITAIQAAQELCSDPELRAIIGELESDQTAAVAAVAQERGVPVLAPTASAEGIAAIGSNVFQLSTPLNVRARAIVDYAVKGLDLKKFAVLAEAGQYGSTMVNAFKNALEGTGGQILIEKWYYSGDNNLSAQFKSIREFGVQKMLNDTVLIRVPKGKVDQYTPRLGKIFVDKGLDALVDSTALAVTAFDAFFMPVLHEDLQYVIPQYAKYNFTTKVFGGVPWNDPDILEEHRRFIDSRYLDNLIFLSDYYVDASDLRYNQFLNDYRSVMRKNPEKLDVFGFDAASVLLSLIGDRRPERNVVTQELSGLKDFQGIEGPISFNENRVNTGIRILQYRNGRILLLK